MTASHRIFLAIAKLTPSRLVLTHPDGLSDWTENFNAYVRAIQRIGLVAGQPATNVGLSENA